MKYKEIISELKEITNENISVNILFNNINPNVKNFDGLKKFVGNNKEFKLLDCILRQRADYDKSAWLGQSVKEYKPDSKATSEFKQFVKIIKNKLKEIDG
jgi:cellulose biosynthesis protein BcsQ